MQLPVLVRQALQAHNESIRGISVAPTDLKFATASDDSTVKAGPLTPVPHSLPRDPPSSSAVTVLLTMMPKQNLAMRNTSHMDGSGSLLLVAPYLSNAERHLAPGSRMVLALRRPANLQYFPLL